MVCTTISLRACDMDNTIRIITPSFNNAQWAEYNVASVLNQTYGNWEWVYIDDNSSDGTADIVEKFVDGDPRVTIIRNDKNLGAMWNYFEIGMADVADDTIVIHLDGDDWLFDIFVLERLNEYYTAKSPWMTYGKMVVWMGTDDVVEARPQNSPYPPEIHATRGYRTDVWRPSHMRTYRAWLLKKLNKQDLIDPETRNYWWEASDLSFQFPCLEMCPQSRIGVVDFYTYVYNASPEQSIRTHGRQTSTRHAEIEHYIRSMPKYSQLRDGNLSTVNIIGYQYDVDVLPTKFTIVYNADIGDSYDVTVITDFDLPRFIRGDIKVRGNVIADLHESREFSNEMNAIYDAVYDNSNLFDRILTHDSKLLTLENAVQKFTMWRTHLYRYDVSYPMSRDYSELKVFEKTLGVCGISSNKAFLPGHKRRLEFVRWLMDNRPDVEMYGRGIRDIESKLDVLKDYRFSIVIENARIDNWVTEKLTDCFLTGTVPIYYGAPNIGEKFNEDGIIQFDSTDQLNDILNSISSNGEFCGRASTTSSVPIQTTIFPYVIQGTFAV